MNEYIFSVGISTLYFSKARQADLINILVDEQVPHTVIKRWV